MGFSERFWVNTLGFQAVWWSSVLLGNAASLGVAIVIALHCIFHSQTFVETRVVFLVGVLGSCVDLLLTAAGVFKFPPPYSVQSLPPIWLLLLWFAFGATLRNSLRAFRKHLILASIAGALAGSSTYLAAAKLGAVNLSLGYSATFVLLLSVWALLFPCLLILTEKLEQSYVSHRH